MRIRVLNLFTLLDRGGAETMCMNLYRNIDRDKVQFDFLVYHKERGIYEDEIEKLGGKVYRIPPIGPISIFAHIRGAMVFFRKHPEYHIVHDHMGANGAFIMWAAKKANVKTRIFHSHGDKESFINSSIKETWRSILLWTLGKIAKRYSNYYFACGQRAAEIFDKRYKVHILNNAIDVERFRFDEKLRENVRNKYSCNDKVIIGNVARFDANKNQVFLIDVLRCALEKRKDIELWLIGDGKQKEELIELSEKLGLKDYIKFFGVRQDVNELLQAMDVFVFPSIKEGLSVACIEAQASGVPCVFSDGFDPLTVIVPENCKIVSLSESPQVWADTIVKMSTGIRSDKTSQIRKKGYDIKQTAKYMQRFYLSRL